MTYGPTFRLREQVIEPVGQSRNALFMLTELAERLGYGHLYPRTTEELLRHALAASPFSLEDVRAAGGTVSLRTVPMEYRKWESGALRPDGRPGFDTPSGKLEIASSLLADHGHDPLPVYTEPAEGPLAAPETARRFPLVLGTGSRVTTDFRSQFHDVPGLLALRPAPEVTINTADAADRGIAPGDLVEISTPRGRVRMAAKVTDDIARGCVDAQMGGGSPTAPKPWREANVNQLTELRFDPVSGFPIYKTLLCEVAKVADSPGDPPSASVE